MTRRAAAGAGVGETTVAGAGAATGAAVRRGAREAREVTRHQITDSSGR